MMRRDDPAYQELAAALKALAHPARLRLLALLAERGGCACGALVDAMPLSQATVSQHLKVLKDADLVIGTTDGPRSCYCVNETKMTLLREHILHLFGAIETCCRQAKAQPHDKDA